MFSQKLKVLFLFALLFSASFALAANVTVVYPTQDSPLFSITAPDNWELVPAEEEGGFFDISGPTGATLSFRAIAGTEEDLNGAIEDAIAYVKENYQNVKLGEAKQVTLDGNAAVMVSGNGEEGGTPVAFDMAWAAMKNGNIAELWFVVAVGDKPGIEQARQIINSFKGR